MVKRTGDEDPSSCRIFPGRETTIEINKDKMGLGLSIVGGSDTLLVSLVFWLDNSHGEIAYLSTGRQILVHTHVNQISVLTIYMLMHQCSMTHISSPSEATNQCYP